MKNIRKFIRFNSQSQYVRKSNYSKQKTSKKRKINRNIFNQTNTLYFEYLHGYINQGINYDNLSEKENLFIHKQGGMIVHSIIKSFIQKKLPEISEKLGKNPDDSEVLKQVKENTVILIFEEYNKLKKKKPEITKIKDELLSYVKKALEGFLSNLYTEYKSDKRKIGQGFDFFQFVNDYMPLYQECQMNFEYNGVNIFFKPDLIRNRDGLKVLIDYKTGNYSSNRFEKDELQILLFAWCLEQKMGFKVDKCEIHYLSQKNLKTVGLNRCKINRIVTDLNVFIHRKKKVISF